MTDRPVYSWDSCIFLAWLGSPVTPSLDPDALAAVAAQIDADRATIVTSFYSLHRSTSGETD